MGEPDEGLPGRVVCPLRVLHDDQAGDGTLGQGGEHGRDRLQQPGSPGRDVHVRLDRGWPLRGSPQLGWQRYQPLDFDERHGRQRAQKVHAASARKTPAQEFDDRSVGNAPFSRERPDRECPPARRIDRRAQCLDQSGLADPGLTDNGRNPSVRFGGSVFG